MAGDYLTVRTRRDGPACVLAVSGELDLVSAAQLLDAAAPAVAADYKQFVLDLAGLTFADCCGARTLAALVQAVPGKCPVTVRSVPPAVCRVLDYTGILLDRMPRQQITLSPAEATRSGAPPRLSPGQRRQAPDALAQVHAPAQPPRPGC